MDLDESTSYLKPAGKQGGERFGDTAQTCVLEGMDFEDMSGNHVPPYAFDEASDSMLLFGLETNRIADHETNQAGISNSSQGISSSDQTLEAARLNPETTEWIATDANISNIDANAYVPYIPQAGDWGGGLQRLSGNSSSRPTLETVPMMRTVERQSGSTEGDVRTGTTGRQYHKGTCDELESSLAQFYEQFRSLSYSPVSQRKVADLIIQIMQLVRDEKKYGGPQASTGDRYGNQESLGSSSQMSLDDSEPSQLGYQTDDTSMLSLQYPATSISQDLLSTGIDHEEAGKADHRPCFSCGKKPLYFCTFKECSYANHSPTDWKRHEETEKHWPQNRYMCLECPASTPVLDANGNQLCQYCGVPFHLLEESAEAHYLCCSTARRDGTTYVRKDHLVSHLRDEHHIGDSISTRRAAAGEYAIASSKWPRQCGFCGVTFKTWDQRMKHIAKDYQKGYHISTWRLPFPVPKDSRSREQNLPPGNTDSDGSDDDDSPSGSSRPHDQQATLQSPSSSQQPQGNQPQGYQGSRFSSHGQRERPQTAERGHDPTHTALVAESLVVKEPNLTLEQYVNDREDLLYRLLSAPLPPPPREDLRKRSSTALSSSFKSGYVFKILWQSDVAEARGSRSPSSKPGYMQERSSTIRRGQHEKGALPTLSMAEPPILTYRADFSMSEMRDSSFIQSVIRRLEARPFQAHNRAYGIDARTPSSQIPCDLWARRRISRPRPASSFKSEPDLTSIRSQTFSLTSIAQNIVEWLQSENINEPYGISEAQKKTSEWVFEARDNLNISSRTYHSHFIKRFIRGYDVYWIDGKAGSGKSTLVKHIENLRTQDRFQAWNWHGSYHPVTSTIWVLDKGKVEDLSTPILDKCAETWSDAWRDVKSTTHMETADLSQSSWDPMSAKVSTEDYTGPARNGEERWVVVIRIYFIIVKSMDLAMPDCPVYQDHLLSTGGNIEDESEEAHQ